MENQDVITKAIGIMAVENKEALVYLLQKNGSLISELSTQDELLDAAFKALKNSANFRKDLSSYLINEAQNDYQNYVDDDFYSNLFGSKNKTPKAPKLPKPPKQKYDPTTGKGGTGVGNLLRKAFTPENISMIVSTGIGLAATRLQNNASKSGEQRAIDYEKAKAETAAAEEQAANAKIEAANAGANNNNKKTPKWVMPVAIGGGLLVVGLIVYFATRKN